MEEMRENEVHEENKMGVMPVNKLLFSMSIPMMISMLAQLGNVNYVWFAFLIAEGVSMVMTALFFGKVYKEVIKPL